MGHIKERQMKARAIERMKDIKEVKRDLALIKSPAAGMKRQAKDMEVDEEMDEEVEELDTSLNVKDLKSKSKSSPRKKVAKIVTEIEADAEMEENWWDQIERQPSSASHHFSLASWTEVTEIILEVTFCVLVAILIFCLTKKSKRAIDDSEKMVSGPPTYDDVITKERDELENLKDLPSYLDALRIEDEMKIKS